MESLNEMELTALNSVEVIKISGGHPGKRILDYLGGWLAGKAFDAVSDYAMDSNRKVDINHARNGGWQQ